MTKFQKFLSVDTKKTKLTRRLTLVFITPLIIIVMTPILLLGRIKDIMKDVWEEIRESYKEYW